MRGLTIDKKIAGVLEQNGVRDAINPETLFFIVENNIGDFLAVKSRVVVNNVGTEMVKIKIIKESVGL